MALTDKLTAVADAIRAKTGKADEMTLDQMPDEIASIQGGGNIPVPVCVASVANDISHNVESVVNVGVAVSAEIRDFSDFPNLISPNMNTWNKNSPAQNAYTSIVYNESDKLNTCQYTGAGGNEVIGAKVTLEAGKTYAFIVEFYTPNTLTGEYSQPYAPYIGFFPTSVFNTGDSPYNVGYAKTTLPLSTARYGSHLVLYTPTSTMEYCVALGTGSILDGVAVQLNMRNVMLVNLSG